MINNIRPLISLIFKCLAVLALVFAFIFFMRMQEEQSFVARYQKEGVVSRALVTSKTSSTITQEGSSGTSGRRRTSGNPSSSVDLLALHVRFVPTSTIQYADFPSRVKEADLPKAPPLTGNAAADSAFTGAVFVQRALYDRTNVGDLMTVVDIRFSGDDPRPIADIAEFDASKSYPWIAIALAVMVLLWLIALRIAKVPPVRMLSDPRTPGS